MRKLLSLILACVIALSLVTVAHAEALIGLQPCREVPAFQQRKEERLSALEDKVRAAEPGSAQAAQYQRKLNQTTKRFDRYSSLLCGEEGLPHLVTDGRLNHAGEFLIPGLLFLYLAGWLGWAGRSYLMTVREERDPEMKESNIDVQLAIKCFISALAWPAVAFKEIASGEIREKEEAVPISPR
jgi:photosystem I subunit 3